MIEQTEKNSEMMKKLLMPDSGRVSSIPSKRGHIEATTNFEYGGNSFKN